MTSNEFRRCALSFPGAAEDAHMGHPDFRVGGKIFATLGYPEDGWGMVKLAPTDQETFVNSAPDIFVPAKGAWGRAGATSVRLSGVTAARLRKALTAAWNLYAPPPRGNGRTQPTPKRPNPPTRRRP
jgi:hypothetical protein